MRGILVITIQLSLLFIFINEYNCVGSPDPQTQGIIEPQRQSQNSNLIDKNAIISGQNKQPRALAVSQRGIAVQSRSAAVMPPDHPAHPSKHRRKSRKKKRKSSKRRKHRMHRRRMNHKRRRGRARKARMHPQHPGGPHPGGPNPDVKSRSMVMNRVKREVTNTTKLS